MKKIIWIFGGHAAGKSKFLNQISEIFNIEIIDAMASASLRSAFINNKVILIDCFNGDDKLEKELIYYSENGTQIIVASRYIPPESLKEHTILLEAIRPLRF